MAGMDEPRQNDLLRPKPSLLSSALWAIAAGVTVFAINTLSDTDMWHRPRFWITSAVGAVAVASIFFCAQWLRWKK